MDRFDIELKKLEINMVRDTITTFASCLLMIIGAGAIGAPIFILGRWIGVF